MPFKLVQSDAGEQGGGEEGFRERVRKKTKAKELRKADLEEREEKEKLDPYLTNSENRTYEPRTCGLGL